MIVGHGHTPWITPMVMTVEPGHTPSMRPFVMSGIKGKIGPFMGGGADSGQSSLAGEMLPTLYLFLSFFFVPGLYLATSRQ